MKINLKPDTGPKSIEESEVTVELLAGNITRVRINLRGMGLSKDFYEVDLSFNFDDAISLLEALARVFEDFGYDNVPPQAEKH